MYRGRRTCLVVVACLTVLSQGCKDPKSSNRDGRYFHLHGESTGILEDFRDVTCLEFVAGNTTLSEPHIEVMFRLDEEQEGDPPRFSPFVTVLLAPLPSADRVRKAAVVRANTRDADFTAGFEFSLVAAEYEYGVPLDNFKSLWIHRLTIPEQTFVHPRDGEITVSGELDGLFLTCN